MRNQYRLLLEKYGLILEMNRREFIQKVGKGAAATGLTPGGMVGKAIGGIAGAAAKSGAASSFLPNDVIMSLVSMNIGELQLQGANRARAIARLAKEKSNIETINNFILNKTGESPLNSLIGTLNLGINSLSGKLTPQQRQFLKDQYGTSSPSPNDIADMIIGQFEGDEDLVHRVMEPLFVQNAVNPNLDRELELYDIWKCHYVDDPVSQARYDTIQAEYKRHNDIFNKQLAQQAKDLEDLEQAYGSRFDRGGGDEDKYEDPGITYYPPIPGIYDPVTVGKKPAYGGPGTYTVDENKKKKRP